MISTVDPEARHGHKTRQERRDGFKAHILAEPETGLVTAGTITKAAGDGSTDADADAGQKLLATDPTLGSGPVQVLADSAYRTGAMLKALAGAGHEALIKPKPLAVAVPGGFTLDDFTFDAATGTLTCPNGLVRRITAKGRATFGSGCRGCPFQARCTTSATGRKIELHPEHEHRAHAQDPGFQRDYRHHRPMIERSIAWLVTGNRRLRYRGTAKNHAWWQLRIAAVNLKRLLNLGLTSREGSWAIA